MANLHYIPLLITTEVGNNGETFIDWDSANEYRAFTIVKYLSDFYISIDNVDPYTLITDTDYWIKITGSSTAGVTWGNITGVISNQVDLYNALAAKEDSANLAAVATSGDYSDLNGTPNLATVATTGDYNDLSNKPALNWQYVDNFNGTAKDINIGECNELLFVAHVYNSAMKVSAVFPPSELTASTWYKIGGAYRTSSTNLDVEMEVVSVSGTGSNFKINVSMSAAYINGSDRASTSSIYVYKR